MDENSMDKNSTNITRRNLFIAGGLGAVAAAAMTGTASAASKNPNIQLVKDFIAAWNDPDKAVTFL